MTHRCVVALEGPCCAGKTTLLHGLLGKLRGVVITHVKCFADHVGGGRFLPRQIPESEAEDERAIRALLTIEADRVAGACAEGIDLVLMDRSVHTLLAHRNALERVTGLDLVAPAERILARSAVAAWPDLVLYLDLPPEAVHDRNQGKFATDNILIDARYNAGFRAYFSTLTDRGHPRVVWLDATLDAVALLTAAAARIIEFRDDLDT